MITINVMTEQLCRALYARRSRERAKSGRLNFTLSTEHRKKISAARQKWIGSAFKCKRGHLRTPDNTVNYNRGAGNACLECRGLLRFERRGITKQHYDAQYDRQNGCCAICKKYFSILCIDHCHDTDENRELLCSNCNSAIGFLKDNPTVCRAAAAYLERFV